MPVSRLTAVVFYVSQVARSAAFYRDSLGAAPLLDYGDADVFLALRLGDVEIHLHAAQAADDHLASTWPAGAASGVGVALHIHASNLARRSQLIQRAGGRVLQEASPVSYTHLRAHETVLDLVCRLLLEKKKKTQHDYLFQ